MTPYFDQYSQNYKNILSAGLGGNAKSIDFYAKQKINHLSRHQKNKKEVRFILDYGCGVGTLFRPLKLAFPSAKLTGVDPSESSLEIARQENHGLKPELFTLSEFEKIKPEPLFDIILISCVLHHAEKALHAAISTSLHSRCSSRGKIAIFEHNPLNPLTRKIVRQCPFDEHAVLIRAKYTRQLLKKTGWHNIKCYYLTFIPYSLEKLSALESLLTWCPLGGQYMIIASPTY